MRHGFLLIDKPCGPTSHDIVSSVRRLLQEKKVGHLGTLDPAASGLLVLAVGSKALKVIELFPDLFKEYEADICFGSISTTYDRDGVLENITPKKGWNIPNDHSIQLVIKDHFLGKIKQVPPAHSAVHVDGKRAYELARSGIEVNLKERDSLIEECKILSYDYPNLILHVRCSSGTYIRSIAHDLGKILRFGAYLSGLRRTKVGIWSVNNAIDPKKASWGHVIPLKEVLVDFPKLDVSDNQAEDIFHGREITCDVQPDTIAWFKELPIAILQPLKDGSRKAKGRKVF